CQSGVHSLEKTRQVHFQCLNRSHLTIGSVTGVESYQILSDLGETQQYVCQAELCTHQATTTTNP
ncbi:unnamed protein product, partial [Arabidopsis halleri]